MNSVEWHDLKDPNNTELDVLAERYHLHPLHIEDCRHRDQRAKVEEGSGYIFVVLKPAHISKEGELVITDLDLFLSRDYLITVQEGECPTLRGHLDHIHATAGKARADQLFYKVTDAVVDAYIPPLDWFSDKIDAIEETVLENPAPATLQSIFETRRGLIAMRRVLGNMRDVASHVQRLETDMIARELWPFLRDVYDHLARNLDRVEMQRDLLAGAMDVYLSSVANRTNQVMKVLTVLGTIALPAIVISGIYGMNTKGLPWLNETYGAEMAIGLMVLATLGLLLMLKKMDWL